MADFRLIDARALRPILQNTEARLFLRGLLVWVGFEQTHVHFEAAPRAHGRSSYGWRSMAGFGASAVLSFSAAPLYWSLAIGLVISGLSLAYGLYAVGMFFFTDVTVPGWASLAALTSFLLGTQFILIGLLGAYVGAIYSEVKGRPHYIVAEDTEEGSG